MKQWVDERIEKATVGFKDHPINNSALTALTEFLEMISNEFSDNSAVLLAPDHEKGNGGNGNTG